MKGLLLVTIIAFFATGAQAQDTTALKEYVGRYTFPDGSFVTSADVALRDTVLSINSEKGNSDLKRMARDSFAFVSYSGVIYFKRNASGKVSGVRVEVEDIQMDGAKDGATAWLLQQPALVRRRVAAK